LVPEELPIVLAIFLALSSLRLSQRGLIIKNKAIIETLGAANIICVDKTGTITKNNLRLKKIIYQNFEIDCEKIDLNDDIRKIIKAGYLATYFNSKDSIDQEIQRVFLKSGIDISNYKSLEEGVINQKFVFSKKYSHQKNFQIFIKGAYEEIAQICRIPSKYEDYILNQIQDLTKVGYRVIALGEVKTEKEDSSKKFDFLGLMAFHDELREETKDYISLCQNNNLRVCMVTGDHKNTAIYYAKEIGLNNYQNVLTGDQIEKLPDSKLKELIIDTNVFARIEPHQKLKLVNLLKSGKNIVAMTGDGVNDSLALKSANIGISIGEGGSDIAKETSDIILMENNLKSIIEGIKEGRRIYRNLGITARYIYSFHLPIILISIFNTFFQLPFLLLPIHIAFLEFIIDPFSTLVFESIPLKAGILGERPRKNKFKLIENMNIGVGTVYGILMFLLIFIPYYFINGFDPESAKTVAILTLLLLNILLIYFNFSEDQNFVESIKNRTFFIAISLLGVVTFLVYLFRDRLSAFGLGGDISEAEYLLMGASVLIFGFTGFFIKKFHKN
jgi:Ca2+-transporting ATPase